MLEGLVYFYFRKGTLWFKEKSSNGEVGSLAAYASWHGQVPHQRIHSVRLCQQKRALPNTQICKKMSYKTYLKLTVMKWVMKKVFSLISGHRTQTCSAGDVSSTLWVWTVVQWQNPQRGLWGKLETYENYFNQ